MADTYAARQDQFGQEYEDFEAQDVVKLIVATGEWLERLVFQPEAADAAMKTLYQVIIADDEIGQRPSASWRDLWTEVSASREFNILTSQYLVDLNAFAYYGLRPDPVFTGIDRDDPSDEETLGAAIEACVAKGRALLDAVPASWAKIADLNISDMQGTILAAEARINLDRGRAVTVEQLAAIARVSVKSIRNLLAPKGGEPDLKLNTNGEVSAPDALRWLQKRSDFKSSLWRETSENSDAPVGPTKAEPDLGDVVFVPVAKDGTEFDPITCRNDRGYTIGPKGAEESLHDYREALVKLARMPTPSWRRPNAAGNWGIVAGVSWQRRPVSNLATGSTRAEGDQA
jgi:hypothetical protein